MLIIAADGICDPVIEQKADVVGPGFIILRKSSGTGTDPGKRQGRYPLILLQ
jgi:hypothetical protein